MVPPPFPEPFSKLNLPIQTPIKNHFAIPHTVGAAFLGGEASHRTVTGVAGGAGVSSGGGVGRVGRRGQGGVGSHARAAQVGGFLPRPGLSVEEETRLDRARARAGLSLWTMSWTTRCPVLELG